MDNSIPLYVHCVERDTADAKAYCEAAGFTYVTPLTGITSEGCYRMNTENKNWEESAHACNDLHERSHLVVILSQEDQSSLNIFLGGLDGLYVHVLVF